MSRRILNESRRFPAVIPPLTRGHARASHVPVKTGRESYVAFDISVRFPAVIAAQAGIQNPGRNRLPSPSGMSQLER